MEHEVAITFLRDTLGMTVRHVARTNEPVIVRRYNRSDVVLVPLWEWRWLKAIEAAIRAVQIDASGFLRNLEDSGGTCLDGGAGGRGNWCVVPGGVARRRNQNRRWEFR